MSAKSEALEIAEKLDSWLGDGDVVAYYDLEVGGVGWASYGTSYTDALCDVDPRAIAVRIYSVVDGEEWIVWSSAGGGVV